MTTGPACPQGDAWATRWVDMIVCSCNVISDGQIKACVDPGPGCPRTAAQVYECLGCSPKCGRCARTIRQIISNALLGIEAPIEAATCASDCAAACPMSKAGHHLHEQVMEPAASFSA